MKGVSIVGSHLFYGWIGENVISTVCVSENSSKKTIPKHKHCFWLYGLRVCINFCTINLKKMKKSSCQSNGVYV